MADRQIPTPEAFGLNQAERIAYVRAVAVNSLGPEVKAPDGVEVVYALHDQQGRRLALFDNRELAFAVARSNEIDAVSVH